jgi:hypothetical protein
MSKRDIFCPHCRARLKIVESEVETDGLIRPTVFSCSDCGHFLGISPDVAWLEPDHSSILSAIAALRADVAKLLAAGPPKKAK